MTGLNQFLELFGQVTLSTVVGLVLAGVFLYMVYKKIREYLIDRYEAEKNRDQKINEALDAVHKYPEYRVLPYSNRSSRKFKSFAKAWNAMKRGLSQWKKQIGGANATNSAIAYCKATVIIPTQT